MAQSKRRGLAVVISDYYDPAGNEAGLNFLNYHKYECYIIQVYKDARGSSGPARREKAQGPTEAQAPSA